MVDLHGRPSRRRTPRARSAASSRSGRQRRGAAQSPTVAIIGFAVLGLCDLPGDPAGVHRRGLARQDLGSSITVARVNVFNYAGFVIGAPLIGGIAQGASLRWAFAALIPVLLVVPLFATWFRVAPQDAPDQAATSSATRSPADQSAGRRAPSPGAGQGVRRFPGRVGGAGVPQQRCGAAGDLGQSRVAGG